ncbi:FadR family transcriptional regulator [Antiquaquibacter oligotrophicus]|uniref:FadR/GntR family transcriptional regulator n=1 Tax=Antiquaquibacter oligotrophicus TaxID=2880260 RepID=UPI002AC9837C|nr:FadR/GntR family transcriptional regulator [Antiquaquibacter oligotrophicus]UDF13962.1 FadR family transcriptional regulator [Antiquaquibacter oligotrophicus]
MLGSLHERVLDGVGHLIVSGELAPGDTMHAEHAEQRFGVSRSVVREAVRVLQSLGLVETVKRVGIRVLPMSRWNLYDPLVIRWRLAQPTRGAQLRSLTELRSAVEPRAAELAARYANDEATAELLALAARMRSVGREGDLELFLELDIRFHSLVLAASGNEMFAKLDGVIAEVLTGRTDQGLMPRHPHEEALQWHVDVADAIQGGRPEDAAAAMERIMNRTAHEVQSIWAGEPRVYWDRR